MGCRTGSQRGITETRTDGSPWLTTTTSGRTWMTASPTHTHGKTLRVAVTVSNVDEEGRVTLSPLTPQVGDEITANMDDPDGGVNDPRWKWQRSTFGTRWSDVIGATASSYTPEPSDGGQMLRAFVSYKDPEDPPNTGRINHAESVPVAVRLVKPTLDLTPLPLRKAKVSWTSIDNANEREEIADLIERLLGEGFNINWLDVPGWVRLREYFRRASDFKRPGSNILPGVDVSFNGSKFANSDLKVPFPGDRGVQFNACLPDLLDSDPDAGYKAFRLAVHESGHALGLSNFEFGIGGLLNDLLFQKKLAIAAHPTIPDAVMNYDAEVPDNWAMWAPSPLNEPDCSPHPFDLLAIYALYQPAR